MKTINKNNPKILKKIQGIISTLTENSNLLSKKPITTLFAKYNGTYHYYLSPHQKNVFLFQTGLGNVLRDGLTIFEAKNIQDIKIVKRGLPKIYGFYNKNPENKHFQKKLYNFIDNLYQSKSVNSLSIYQIKILTNIDVQISYENIYEHWIISVNNGNTVLFQNENDLSTLHTKNQIDDILYEICKNWLEYMKRYKEGNGELYKMLIEDISERTLTGFYIGNDESKLLRYGNNKIVFYSYVYNMTKFYQFSEGIHGLDYFFKKYKLSYLKFEKLINDISQLEQFKTELRSLESIIASEENSHLYEGSIFLILSDTKHIVTTFKIKTQNKSELSHIEQSEKNWYVRLNNSKTLNFADETDEAKLTITQIGNNLQFAKKIFSEEDLSENCDFYLNMIPNNKQHSTIQNNPKSIISSLGIQQIPSEPEEGFVEESTFQNKLNYSHQTNNTNQTASFNNVGLDYNKENSYQKCKPNLENTENKNIHKQHFDKANIPQIKVNYFQKEITNASSINRSLTITQHYNGNNLKDNISSPATAKNSPALLSKNKSLKLLGDIPKVFLSTNEFSRNGSIKMSLAPDNIKNNCIVRVKGKNKRNSKKVRFLDFETKEQLAEIILVESYKNYNYGNTFIDAREEEEDEKKKSNCCSIH